jgi:hypothetical protein
MSEVIMHNMTVDSECDGRLVFDEEWYYMAPLVESNTGVPSEFTGLLTMHQKINDKCMVCIGYYKVV